MADYGARIADRAIMTVERRLNRTYAQAQRELKKKLKDFTDKYAAKDAAKRKQLEEGKITPEDYANWKAGQVFQQRQWQNKIASVIQVMFRSNEEAADIIHEKKLDVFVDNYNYNAFLGEKLFAEHKIDKQIKTGISFELYNTQAVARLVEKDPQTLPKWKIDEEKDYKWNLKKVNNIIKQGIIQGESIPQMTERLCKDLASVNKRKMEMFARTAITGAQNAGRQQQMKDAAKLGIKQKKQWLATLDGRTRDTHRQLDGQEVDFDKAFNSELGKILFPGDPTADPANVFNCRCTMITIYPDYPMEDPDWRESEEVDGQHYREWKASKPNYYDEFRTKIDRSTYPNVQVSAEMMHEVDSTMNDIFAVCPALEDYFEELYYTATDGMASARIDGKAIHLDKKIFQNMETAKAELDDAIHSKHSVNAKNPMFMVAHEAGHCIENMVIFKKLRLENAVIGNLQRAAIQSEQISMGKEYFLHMGFDNETKEEIYDIITKEFGLRALSSTSEMFAQAFAQVRYGTKPAPHAEKLVKYVLSLAR